MGSPAQAPQGQQTPSPAAEAGVTAALVVVLLSELAPAATAAQALPLLAQLGIPPRAAVQALSLALPHVEVSAPRAPARSAEAHIARTESARRAAYIVRAARRFISSGHTIAAERRYLAQHLAAVRARREVALRIDREARRYGPLLGWYSILDERTDPICRLLHGTVFEAQRPPIVGYPGTLHGGTCRCWAGAPRPQAASADAVLQAALARRDIEFATASDGTVVIDLELEEICDTRRSRRNGSVT